MPLILHAQFVTGLFLERITLDLRISYCSMSITGMNLLLHVFVTVSCLEQ